MSARYSKTLGTGLVVLGAGGEPTMLSDEETRLVLGAFGMRLRVRRC